ncbi:hypothetical protein K9N68_39625 (plasmid) [Kovacikia minuta CCNUW1]|uniref:hypothetical protein n=1 Tax=Kovacikia minuta TaxID=2931930 RepID=UPI001CCE33DF|nr:hypothetical protein [Kovacikia minuta]UBF30766.1 hypothetical protein K9N68_39625 [Kovacikia minuta CCNUW1]
MAELSTPTANTKVSNEAATIPLIASITMTRNVIIKPRRRKKAAPASEPQSANDGGSKGKGPLERVGYSYDPDSGQWKHRLGSYMTLIHFLGLLVLLIVCLWNVSPYEVVVQIVGQKFINSGFIELLNKLPVLSWIIQFLGSSLVWLIAFAIWAFFQTIELLPIIMRNDRKFIRTILYRHDRHPKFQFHPNDPPIARALKRYYNLLPLQTYAGARRMATLIYVIDLFVCAIAYPPAEGGPIVGIFKFLFYLLTAQWTKIDWLNVVLMVSTVFVVELCVKLLFWINQFRHYSKETEEAESHA